MPHYNYDYGLMQMVLTMPLTNEVFEAINTAEHRDRLRTSQVLTKEQWDQLWEKNLPAHLASSLLNRTLTPDQMQRIIADEKRGSVLSQQFRPGGFDEFQQLDVLTKAKGSQYVYHALGSGHFHHPHLETAARHFRGLERLEWLTFSDQSTVSDDDVLETLVYCNTPQGIRHIRNITEYSGAVARVLAQRPSLLAKIFALPEFPHSLTVQLGVSRFLTDHAHQDRLITAIDESFYEMNVLGFIANPVVRFDAASSFESRDSERIKSLIEKRRNAHGTDHIEVPFDEIENLNHIEWVLSRSMPTRDRVEGRPNDLAALAVNKNITRSQAIRAHAALKRASTMSVLAESVNKAFDSLERKFGFSPAPRLINTGFWERLLNEPMNSWRFHDFAKPTTWLLDPSSRPWSDADIAAAYAEISEASMQVFEAGDCSPWNLDLGHTHAYLMYHLGNNPKRWQMLAGLAPKHHGSLARLTAAVKRLGR